MEALCSIFVGTPPLSSSGQRRPIPVVGDGNMYHPSNSGRHSNPYPMRESSADGLFQDRQMKSMLPGEHPKIIEIFHAGVEAPQLHHSLPFFRNQRFFGVTSDRCGWHFRNQGRVLQFHGFGIQVIAKAYIYFHGDLFTLNLRGKLDSKP